MQSLRAIFDFVADLAGFWPQRWHPLAGASYRDDIIEGLDAALSQPVNDFGGVIDRRATVLVGHSQGSVISLWFVAMSRHSAPASKLALVTCGSPIQSLYCTVFPRHFTPELLATARERLDMWVNFSRPSDPIGADIGALGETGSFRNETIADPRDTDERIRIHSDYWTEPAQCAAVAEAIARFGDGATCTGVD